MATGLIDIMKRASMDVIENSKPCDVKYGVVTSTSPLKIQVTNQLILPSSVLVVPKHLTKYTVPVVIAVGESDPTDDIGTGERTLTIDNSLKVGDKVAILRQSGGQSYYILDKV